MCSGLNFSTFLITEFRRGKGLLSAIVSAIVATLVTITYFHVLPKVKHYIEKKTAPRKARVKVPYNVAVVDASNVALYGEKADKRKKGKVKNIILMIKTLEDRGFKVFAVADASLRHKVDDPAKLERLVTSGKVAQVPPGTPADYFILSIAEAEHAIVVSNDVFKEWRELFPWVKDKNRVVRYLIENDRVYLYPDVRPKKKWKEKYKRSRPLCVDLEETQEEYWKRYIM